MMVCSIGFSLNALFADFNVCQLSWITYYILINTLCIKYNIFVVNFTVKILIIGGGGVSLFFDEPTEIDNNTDCLIISISCLTCTELKYCIKLPYSYELGNKI